MSDIGRGMFSYIPDSSMIGTVFCNFIANAMYRPRMQNRFFIARCQLLPHVRRPLCNRRPAGAARSGLGFQRHRVQIAVQLLDTRRFRPSTASAQESDFYRRWSAGVRLQLLKSFVIFESYSSVPISSVSQSTFSFQNCLPLPNHFPYAPLQSLMARAQYPCRAKIPNRSSLCSRNSELWCATWKPSVRCIIVLLCCSGSSPPCRLLSAFQAPWIHAPSHL
jgi:hypothetical protein